MALTERAPSVFEIEIERDGLDYRAGDCTLLIRDDRVDSRPYSFSSHPDEPVLRFLVRRLEGPSTDQSFSSWLGSRQPGDEIGVGTPFGWFRPGQSTDEVWFATGTGVSPFLSALRARKPLLPLAFSVGVRGPEDAVLRGWLEERLSIEWAFSRFSEEGRAPRRVSALAEVVPVKPEIRYFLCGNQRMIRTVAAALTQRGVHPGQIHEELFFQ